VGYNAGTTVDDGDYNILIGYQTEPSVTGANYELNIGNLIKGNIVTKFVNITGDILTYDNLKHFFGDADDVSISFNGTDMEIIGEVGSPDLNVDMNGGSLNLDNGNYSHDGVQGFTGTCINVTYSGGIAIACND